MNEKTATIIADEEAIDRDIVEFKQAWEKSPGMSEELEIRLRFETLIADLSLKFINLPANEVDLEIKDAQRRVCQCLGRTCVRFGNGQPSLPDSLH